MPSLLESLQRSKGVNPKGLLGSYEGRGIAPSKSTFTTIVEGMDKPDAHFRTVLGRMLGDKKAPNPKDIWSGKAVYEARDLLNAFEQKTGKDMYFGNKNDKNLSTMNKVGNFMSEMAIYLGLAPSNLLLGAPAKAVGKALGVGSKLTLAQKAATGAATGLAIGAMTGDNISESLRNAVIGAGVLGAGNPALRFAATNLGKVGTAALDTVARGMHPEAFEAAARGAAKGISKNNVEKLGFSKAFDIVREAQEKNAKIGRGIREMDTNLGLTSLTDDSAKQLDEYMLSKSSEWHKHRNGLERDLILKKTNANPFPTSIELPTNSMAYQARRKGNDLFGDRYMVIPEGNKFKVAASKAGQPFKFISKPVSMTALNKQIRGYGKNNVHIAKDINAAESVRFGVRDAKGRMPKNLLEDDYLNTLSTKSNTYVGRVVDQELAKIGDNALTTNVKSFVKRNRAMMDNWNAEMKTRHLNSAKSATPYIDTVPIDFHMMELNPDLIGKGTTQYDNIKTGFVRRVKDAPIQTAGTTLPERLYLESERFKNAYLTRQEKIAKNLLNDIAFGKNKDKGVEGFQKFMNGFDNFTGFLKQQHLTFSHSWVMNNFTDNTVKAFLSGGAKNGWKTFLNQADAILRSKTNPMVNDLLKITDPNAMTRQAFNFSDDITKVALDHNAISEGFFSEAFKAKGKSKPFMYATMGDEEAARILAKADNMGGIEKLGNEYKDFLSSTVGRTGQLAEGATRATTFKTWVDTILDNKALLSDLGIKMDGKTVKSIIRKNGYDGAKKVMPKISNIYDEAARVVNETFFDYGKTTAFEEKVMKRIFPYWTFFSRNVPYWIDAMGQNPEGVNKVFSYYKSIGRRPTEREREGIPDYLLDKAVRISSAGKYITSPNLSLLDALSVPKWRESSLEKLHPILKAAKQYITKTDDFGGELFPSDTKAGRKRVYGSGVKFSPVTRAIYRDSINNKLYTDSDIFTMANMLQKNLLPAPLIDTIAKIVNDVKVKEISYAESISNMSPVKTKTLTTKELRAVRDNRRRDVKRLERAKRKIKRDRSRGK